MRSYSTSGSQSGDGANTALVIDGSGDKPAQLARGLEAQLGAQQTVVALELMHGPGSIALRQVHTDQGGARTLAKRLSLHRRQRRQNRISEPRHRGQNRG